VTYETGQSCRKAMTQSCGSKAWTCPTLW